MDFTKKNGRKLYFCPLCPKDWRNVPTKDIKVILTRKLTLLSSDIFTWPSFDKICQIENPMIYKI